MGCTLDPLLGNITTEMEKIIIRKIIDDKILLFYGHFVDDTLVSIIREHLKLVHDALNNFTRTKTSLLIYLMKLFPIFLALTFIQMA